MNIKLFRYKRTSRGLLSRTRKSKLPIVFIGVFCLGFAFLIIFINVNFLRIKKITVNLNQISCTSEEAVKSSSNLKDKQLFFYDEKLVNANLKKKHLCIKDISFSKKLPEEIVLNIFGRTPVIVLNIINETESTASSSLTNTLNILASPSAQEASGAAEVQVLEPEKSESFLVDDSGFIFAVNQDNKTIPQLFFYGKDLKLGIFVEEDILKNSLKIFETLKSFTLNVKEGKIYSQQTLLINAKPILVFNIKDRVGDQLGALQLILEKAKINDENIEFVDLRFDKPIIRFSEKKKK